MAVRVARYNIGVSATDRGVRQTFRRITGSSQELRTSIQRLGVASLSGQFSQLGLAGGAAAGQLVKLGAVGVVLAASLLAVGSAFKFVQVGIGAAAQFEQTTVAFETIIGNATTAKNVLQDLSAFAASTPFQFQGLADAGKVLLAFGVPAEQLVDQLRTIADVSSGIGAPLKEIAQLYGKAKVQGRLFAEDVNQLTGRGIDVNKEFAKQFNTTTENVRKLTEAGAINFSNLEEAFRSLTAEGGPFFEQTARQSQTLIGRWSTLKDTFLLSARALGTTLLPLLKTILEFAIDTLTAINSLFGITAGTTANIDIDVKPKIFELTEAQKKLAEKVLQTDEQKEAAKQAKKSQEDAERAAKQTLDRLTREGKTLSESLRTPGEILAASIRNVDKLLAGGFIGNGDYNRAIAKAKEDFLSQLEAAQEIRKLTDQGPAALIRRGSRLEIETRIKDDTAARNIAAEKKAAQARLDRLKEIVENTATPDNVIVNVEVI